MRFKNTLLGFGLFFLACAASANTMAYQWHYAWVTAENRERSISLDISDDTVHKAYLGEGDLWDFRRISDLIISQIRLMAVNASTREMSFTVEGTGIDNFTVKTNAPEHLKKQASQEIRAIYDFVKSAMKPVEDATYYTYDEKRRGLGIEYNEIARDYETLILRTLITLGETLDTDDPARLRDELLDMLQSLPYTDLSKDDFPLLNPARMLLEKRGDCESKQLFMASALKLLYPERHVYLVMLPDQEHIVLETTNEAGQDFYMDATGPDRIPAGKLNKNTTINRHSIRYEIIL